MMSNSDYYGSSIPDTGVDLDEVYVGVDEVQEESSDEDDDDDEDDERDVEGGGAAHYSYDISDSSDDDDDDDDDDDEDEDDDEGPNMIFDSYADEPSPDKDHLDFAEENEEKRRRRLMFGTFFCCLILILAIVLGVALGGNDDDKQSTSESGASGPPIPVPTATTTTTTREPTPAPTRLPPGGGGGGIPTLSPESSNETKEPSTAGVDTTESPTLVDGTTASPTTAAPTTPGATASPTGINPTPSPTGINTTPGPTGVDATASPTQTPTQDPNKTFFPVSADTYIADGAFADQAFGTADLLQLATSPTLNSLAFLQFDLADLPPEPDDVYQESSIELRLVRTGFMSSERSQVTIGRLPYSQGEIDMATLTWNDYINGSLGNGMIMGPTFTVSDQTEVVQVQIKRLLRSEIQLRRRLGRELQETQVTLVLHIKEADGPSSVGFQSGEGGTAVAPVIFHKNIARTITSCSQEPCGAFATCWELEGGEITCECDDGVSVAYRQACPEGSFVCPPGRSYDAAFGGCVCPVDKALEDDEGFCFAGDSPCLEDPCADSIGATCTDDSTAAAGYVCKCSDNSVVSTTENCNFSTITSCDPPFPCAIDAVCFIEENSDGQITIGCECVDGRGVGYGESCANTAA